MAGAWRMFLVPMLVMGINKLNPDWTDPTIVWATRIAYASSLVLIGVFYFVSKMSVAKRNQTDEMVEVKKQPGFREQLAAAQNTAANAATPAADASVKMSVREYDEKQLNEFVRSQIIGVLIVSFLHFKYDAMMPLLLQAIMNTFSLATSQIFQIHVLRMEASGSRARPFQRDNPMDPFGLQKKMQEMQKEVADTKQPQPKQVTGPAAADSKAEKKKKH